MLAIHGDADPTVPVQSVKEISSWNPMAQIKILEGADHTFGGGHPYESLMLPSDLEKVINFTIEFFQNVSKEP